VNHAEPATLYGNVVDRATPSPLSGRCLRVVLIYAPGSSPPEGKRDSAVWLQLAIVGRTADTEPDETTRRHHDGWGKTLRAAV